MVVVVVVVGVVVVVVATHVSIGALSVPANNACHTSSALPSALKKEPTQNRAWCVCARVRVCARARVHVHVRAVEARRWRVGVSMWRTDLWQFT